jgi:ABC-type xylose transport system permease subunit
LNKSKSKPNLPVKPIAPRKSEHSSLKIPVYNEKFIKNIKTGEYKHPIPAKWSVYKNTPKKVYRKAASTKKKHTNYLKITYFILSLIVFSILVLTVTKLLVLNGISVFLLCLLVVLPLFPYVRRLRLPGILFETSTTNDKQIVPESQNSDENSASDTRKNK